MKGLLGLIVLALFVYLFYKSSVFRSAFVAYELFVLVVILLSIATFLYLIYRQKHRVNPTPTPHPGKFNPPRPPHKEGYIQTHPYLVDGVDYRTRQIQALADANGC